MTFKVPFQLKRYYDSLEIFGCALQLDAPNCPCWAWDLWALIQSHTAFPCSFAADIWLWDTTAFLPGSEVGPVWILGISRPKRQLAELHPWCSAAGAENRRAVVGPQVSGRVATGQSLCPLNAEAKGLLPSAWKGRLKMEIALHRGAQVNILHPCSWMHTVIKWGFSRLPFSFCFSLCYSSHLSSHFLGRI